MLELEEARERILAAIPTLPSESIGVSAALGRILAAPVHSPVDLPGFDNSAMDGYAVRADDLIRASAESPVALQLRGETPAGAAPEPTVTAGTCVRVFTGSVLPEGADAVVMQEDTRRAPGEAKVLFSEPIKPWENIRLRGEDVKQGALLFAAGDRVGLGALAVLAATGHTEIRANRRPEIGVLSTGNELIEAGQPLTPGKIYESNRTTLAALLAQSGANVKTFPHVPDDLSGTQAALENAFNQSDGVVTTGGVSVGEYDYVKSAFTRLGGALDFWQVAIRPGKPFVFGRWGDKFLFGLPGNPISAVVTFLLLVRPTLLRWQGAANCDLPGSPGTLMEPLVNRGERRHFVRVTTDAAGGVRSAGVQSSHILSSLAKANGLVNVPPRTTLKAGSIVSVLRWD